MIYAIDQNDAEVFAVQTAEGIVKLIAVDYNWGAPVGGRSDTDFLRIWAVAQGGLSSGQVFLQGAHNDDWSINVPLNFKKVIKNKGDVQYSFYYIELGYQFDFPTQFVIRFDSNDGVSYYDNNGGYGCNYRLIPYHNRGASVVSGQDALLAFSDITPVRLYYKSLTGKTKPVVKIQTEGIKDTSAQFTV